jgi:hypothetical protein
MTLTMPAQAPAMDDMANGKPRELSFGAGLWAVTSAGTATTNTTKPALGLFRRPQTGRKYPQ